MKKDITFLIALMLTLVSFFAAQEQLTGRVTNDCTDTDDGLEYAVKGTVTVDNEELTDSCQENAVVEYYCSQNQARIKVYACPNGCAEGACKKQEITRQKESLKLGTTTNQIEIGEYLGDVIDTLTDTKTPALASSRVNTGKSTTLANQYLRFKDTDFASGRILFTEDDHNTVADFLVFEEDNYTLEYELEFSPGLASAIESGKLVDLENEDMFMLGRTYTIVEAEKKGNQVRIKLLSGAIQDTLAEGASNTYRINGKEYTVKVMLIDDTARAATISVNNKVSGQRKVGETEIIGDMILGIAKMSVSEAAEQQDQVTFILDANTLELVDSDVADDSFSQGVKIDGKSLSNTYTKIKGGGDSTEYTITSIRYRLKAESLTGTDVFIPAGKGLRENTRYPQALLGDWDIKYNGLDAKKTIIKFDPSGDRYDLEFTNVKGQRLETTLVTNVGGNLKIGKNDNTLHFIEGTSVTNYIIAAQDDVVLTSSNDRTGITNVLRYISIDTSNKKLFFNDVVEGSKETSYTGTEGTDANADLVVNGNTYRVYVGGAPDYKLAMDLNHDGDVASDEVNIVVQGGGLLDLGSTIAPNTDFNMTLTTLAKQFDTATNDEAIIISILASGSNVDLDLPTQTALTIESRTGKKLGMSDYGVFLKQETKNPDKLFIEYPLSQATGNIELVFSEEEKQNTARTKKEEKTEQRPEPKKDQPEVKSTESPTQEEPKPVITYEEQATGFRAWIKRILQAITNWF